MVSNAARRRNELASSVVAGSLWLQRLRRGQRDQGRACDLAGFVQSCSEELLASSVALRRGRYAICDQANNSSCQKRPEIVVHALIVSPDVVSSAARAALRLVTL